MPEPRTEDLDADNGLDQLSPTTGQGGISTRTLLIGLGAITTIAFVLALVRARRQPVVSAGVVDLGDNADWRVSIEHLAGNIQLRFAGIDERLDALSKAKVEHTSLGAPAAPAAVSMVPEALVPDASQNGDHAVAPVDDPHAPPPPGPAAVSAMEPVQP